MTPSPPDSRAVASPTAPMTPTTVVILLSLLMGIQPVTTDLYLPALPALREGFGAGMPQVQLTLTALLLAFGGSQLVWGPISDRFGRRPVLLLGLLAYTVAAVAAVLTTSMNGLIIARTLQGAAMGAAVMGGRAVVRDLYDPVQGATVMAKALSGLGVIACLSAPLGSVLAKGFGWRVALAALAVFGAAALTAVLLRYRETLAQPDPQALQPARLLRRWREIVRHPVFQAYSALSAASYAGLFTFLAASSFVFIQVLGLSQPQYGLVMFSMCLAYLSGTVLCRRLLRRLSVAHCVRLAAFGSLLGGGTMALLATLGVHTWWAVLLPHWLYMLAHGVHLPCSQSGSVGPFPQAAGTASALNGFVMMVVAFGMGLWLGRHMDGTVFPLVYGIAFWSGCIALIAWLWVQRAVRVQAA